MHIGLVSLGQLQAEENNESEDYVLVENKTKKNNDMFKDLIVAVLQSNAFNRSHPTKFLTSF